MNFWEGKNIRLRAIEEDDADLFFEALQNMEIQRNESDIRMPMSHKASVDFAIEQSLKDNGNNSPFLIIEDKNKNKVGMATPSLVDNRVGVFTCGMFILPEYQRKGYAKEALLLILKFFFEELRCQKFNASVYSYNNASNKLCKKIGLVVEGKRRNMVYTNGEFYDEVLYGLTLDEYFSIVKLA